MRTALAVVALIALSACTRDDRGGVGAVAVRIAADAEAIPPPASDAATTPVSTSTAAAPVTAGQTARGPDPTSECVDASADVLLEDSDVPTGERGEIDLLVTTLRRSGDDLVVEWSVREPPPPETGPDVWGDAPEVVIWEVGIWDGPDHNVGYLNVRHAGVEWWAEAFVIGEDDVYRYDTVRVDGATIRASYPLSDLDQSDGTWTWFAESEADGELADGQTPLFLQDGCPDGEPLLDMSLQVPYSLPAG